jgi:hypothetical protein
MKPPDIINIVSDGNQLKFVTTLKGKETLFVYEYIVSENKLGLKLSLTERDLGKLISNNQ